MLTFKKGDPVRQVVKPIEGTIVRATIVNDTELAYHVAYKDAAGAEHERVFKADEIEAVPQEQASPAQA